MLTPRYLPRLQDYRFAQLIADRSGIAVFWHSGKDLNFRLSNINTIIFYREAIDDQFLAFSKIDHAEFGGSSLANNRNPGVRKDFRYVFPDIPFGA
jgi:hypothetical protein